MGKAEVRIENNPIPEYTRNQMTFVLASDIHANLFALNAFYQYLEEHALAGCPRFYLGDYVNLGPFPRETVERLSSETGSVFLRGNHDRYVIDESLLKENPYFPSSEGMDHTRWTHNQLTEENLAWLRTLRSWHRFHVSGWDIILCHGTPDDNDAGGDMQGAFSGDNVLYISGHTHIPRNEMIQGMRIVNPGSLGKPLDGDNRASFGIIRLSGDTADFDLVRIPYDIDGTVAALEERNVPWRAGIIQSIKTAAYSNEQ